MSGRLSLMSIKRAKADSSASTNRCPLMKMTHPPSQAATTIPADDPIRSFTLAQPDNLNLLHVGLVGDTYTILVAGKDTAGRYALIDMHIPPGGGPPPHRHDFEEMFSVLEGEIEFTFRGKKIVVRAGETINIPANGPHQFQNKTRQSARLLCLCSPAGQEEFFREVGVPVATRTTPPPPLDEEAEAAFVAKVKARAPKYRTELLPP
jgi:quercetin dioxygenase-like cupin family protein